MPNYDRQCKVCGKQMIDCLEPVNAGSVQCECGGETERIWLTFGAAIVPDEIPGGVWIRHGICNEDGTPRKYYSKSEMKREAERRGLVNRVEHVGSAGSDKNKHTSRWV